MNQVITFYSYKGGVGRTMALANTAALLSQWGYKILLIDWDLEAPGLENFFKEYIDIKKTTKKKGLIDILDADPNYKYLWKDLLIPVTLPGSLEPIHLLTVGDRSNDYFNKVRNFDVTIFYEKKDGGNFIEMLRNQWKETYDFVLIDSRTGITDIGGICTIQLPDILVLLFTATDMGFNGVLDVAKRAVNAQQSLPFDRFKLISLPIPARFDTITEFKNSQAWLDKFSKQLQEIYNDWLPTSVDRRKFLELTKIPYVAYFSFGEKLPVIEQGVSDPSSLGYAYETISALIANNFDSIDYLMENRDSFIDMALKSKLLQKQKEKSPKDAVKIFISYSHKDRTLKDKLESHLSILQRKGMATFWSDQEIVPGMKWRDVIQENLVNSQICLLLISPDYLASTYISKEMELISQQAEQNDILVIPIILRSTAWEKRTWLAKRQVLPKDGKPLNEQEDPEETLAEIVKQIEKSILYIKNKTKRK